MHVNRNEVVEELKRVAGGLIPPHDENHITNV